MESPLFTEACMKKETLLMASEEEIAGNVPGMEWSTAAMVIEVCVDEMLDKIAKNPDDYLPDADIEIIEAWQRILRG